MHFWVKIRTKSVVQITIRFHLSTICVLSLTQPCGFYLLTLARICSLLVLSNATIHLVNVCSEINAANMGGHLGIIHFSMSLFLVKCSLLFPYYKWIYAQYHGLLTSAFEMLSLWPGKCSIKILMRRPLTSLTSLLSLSPPQVFSSVAVVIHAKRQKLNEACQCQYVRD